MERHTLLSTKQLPWKLTWLAGKSPCSIGNTSLNGEFSIVMLVFGGVDINSSQAFIIIESFSGTSNLKEKPFRLGGAGDSATFLTNGCIYICIYGCFRKWWYPQIINSNRVFPYKPAILGYHYFWKHPYIYICMYILCGLWILVLISRSSSHEEKKSCL